VVAAARSETEIEAAFDGIGRARVEGVLIADDPFFTVQRRQIVDLVRQLRLPAIYYTRQYAADGGLISYGSNTNDNYRLAGGYVGRLIGGAKPSELPVLQPTKFELVINLKAAKALGLTVSPALLARTDEVIE
jgi:putative ABC transport system substrate-binding protein